MFSRVDHAAFLLSLGGWGMSRSNIWTTTLLDFDLQQAKEPILQQVVGYASTPACLSDWFIRHWTHSGELVCDLVSGRGTTALSAVQLGRHAIANDINPISCILLRGRLQQVNEADVLNLLKLAMDTPYETADTAILEELSAYYAPGTTQLLLRLRRFFLNTEEKDRSDAWHLLRFLAIERLYGPGDSFLSTSTPGTGKMNRPEQQKRRNLKRGILCLKEKNLVNILHNRYLYFRDSLQDYAHLVQCFSQDARSVNSIPPNSVDLHFIVPPELNTRIYVDENWLRLWFIGMDEQDVIENMEPLYNISQWQNWCMQVLQEQNRTLKQDGHAVWLMSDTAFVRKHFANFMCEQAAEIGWSVTQEYTCRIPVTETSELGRQIAVRAWLFHKPGE